MSLYGADLAHVHHAGFGGYARAAGPVVIGELRRAGLGSGCVVDLGCGSGILAARLVDAGYDVLGIDVSSDMIRLARKSVRAARFRVESLFRASIPPAVGVVAVGEGLNYLPRGRSRAPALRPLLRRVYRALAPGGVFLFDVIVGPLTAALAPVRTHAEGRDWTVLSETEGRGTRRFRRTITIFRRRGASYRRTREVHDIWLYDRDAVGRMLRREGFRVRTARRYGAVSLLPARVAFVARKPAR